MLSYEKDQFWMFGCLKAEKIRIVFFFVELTQFLFVVLFVCFSFCYTENCFFQDATVSTR